MKSIFTSDFFVGNRKTLRQKCGNEYPIVLTAHGNIQRSGDVAFPFRQDSNFWYLTGLETPELIVVLDSKEEFIILPEREAILDVFEGAIDKQELKSTSGINTIYDQHEGWEKLRALAKKHGHINAPLHKSYDEHHHVYSNPAKSRLVRWIQKLHVELHDIRMHLVHMRMIKQEPEIAAVQQAVDTTIDAFNNIFTDTWHKINNNEREIDARLTYEFTKRGGNEAYPSIVAGGKNACTLHYVENNQSINKDDLLLIDAGAECNNYAADITRVFAPNEMTKAQTTVYDAVKEAQSMAINLIKPGLSIKKLQKEVALHIGRFLKAQKLITKLDVNQIAQYYPHAVSHHLGLDVHDVADYSQPLAKGMIITVEPGIYIPQWSIGVRIEDDILVTNSGAKVLSARLPS